MKNLLLLPEFEYFTYVNTTVQLLGWQITEMETHRHTHNREVIKHRDMETSDETLN